MLEQPYARRVLVGVDGSAGSLAAAELGAWEARRRAATVLLAYGTPADTYPFFGIAPGIPAQHLFDEAETMLTEVAAALRHRHPELTIDTAVLAGGGAGALVELSRDASLVVVGSRGLGGFTDLFLGSVAAEVSMHAHTPAIVVRPSIRDSQQAVSAARVGPSVGPVLVGVDGSPSSLAAVAFAFDEAAARQTPLEVGVVWTDDIPEARPSAVEDAARRLVAESVEGWADKYPAVAVTHRVVRHLSPAWGLVEASENASLLVVGATGRGGFASLLLGSVSRSVVAHARCPVAIVRDHT